MAETEDFLLIATKELDNPDLFKYKGEIVHTVYSDNLQQVFYTATRNSVYRKDEQKVYDMEIDAWTRMVLKINTVVEIWEEQRFWDDEKRQWIKPKFH